MIGAPFGIRPGVFPDLKYLDVGLAQEEWCIDTTTDHSLGLHCWMLALPIPVLACIFQAVEACALRHGEQHSFQSQGSAKLFPAEVPPAVPDAHPALVSR